MSTGAWLAIIYVFLLSGTLCTPLTHDTAPETASDPFAFLRPIDVNMPIAAENTIHPTSASVNTNTATIHRDPTWIRGIFIDDLACGTNYGWSHCRSLNNLYHGPFSAPHAASISRVFQCDSSLSSNIKLSFSIAFDCNNAFSDEIALFVNDHQVSHFNPFPIDDTTHDEVLLSLSTTCHQWFIRHITQSFLIAHNQSFELTFASLLKSNLENLVIYNIEIQCITDPTHAPTSSPSTASIAHRFYVAIDRELNCKQYLKGGGIIYTNITSVEDKFIAFKISTDSDSELRIVSDVGSWTFMFSVTDKVIRFYTEDAIAIETYPLIDILDDSHKMFWISWRYNHFMIGMGHIVHKVQDVIILYHFTSFLFTYAVYSGSDWVFYDYPASEWCVLDMMSAISTASLSHAHPFYVYSSANINSELWETDRYLMFDIYSTDSTYIEMSTKSINASIRIMFQSNEINNTRKAITILKQVQNSVETLYCTKYSDYDLSLNWTFWIYWDDEQMSLGIGKQIGNSIIYHMALENLIDDIEIVSTAESEWIFYSTLESLDADVIHRDTELFCHRYYTHWKSKSQISKINSMIYDHWMAFSVKSSNTDSAPQIYLSYWNTQKNNNNNNNNNDFNIDNHWWWSIELQLAKQLMFVANNSDHQIASILLPTKFRIKDEVTGCYLDITFGAFIDENHIRCCREHGLHNEELNVFWNCEEHGVIWRYSEKTKRIYHKEYGLYLIFGSRDYGFQIATNERNAKLSPYIDTELAIKPSVDDHERYRISFRDTVHLETCQLARSDTQNAYKTLEGKACFGYEAKFKCDGAGVDTKLIIAQLAFDNHIWITSFDNNNIQIGIGQLIGNEEDVVFMFEYEYIDYSILYDSLQYIWIDSVHATDWTFYDYDTSVICDAVIIKQYNISKHALTHNVDYALAAWSETFVPKYLWNDQHLMFNISSAGDVWIQFQMKTDDVFIVQYGKDSVKDLCDDTRGVTDHVVIMKNAQYKYCSPYSGYDLSLPYLFWIYWKDDKLELGNGAYLGQSVITAYNEFNSHQNIASISIGSEIHDSIWRFYTTQKHFTLNNAVFAPNDVLLFTFKYDKLGILQKKANISIVSEELSINCVLIMDFEDDAPGCRICDGGKCSLCDSYKEEGIGVNVPDYKHIKMHQHFDSEYLVTMRSNDILLAETQYILKRRNFMNLTIDFELDITIGSRLKILKYEMDNDKITQNASHIGLVCASLRIDAVIWINYAAASCVVCRKNGDNNACNSCSDGISFIVPDEMDLVHASQHTINMQSNDTHLARKRIKIYLHPCDVGYGLKSTQKECVLCEMNHFNVDRNDNECHSCSISSDFNRIGYECRGSSDILVQHNWWITIAQHSPGWQYILGENHTAYDIISSVCPPLFCCQHKDGCHYTPDGNALCANNRDASVALCGRCAAGYSEVYGSTKCKICDDDHYIYLFVCLLFGFVYAIAISFVIQYNGDTDDADSDCFKSIVKQVEEFNYTQLMMHDYIAALFISLFGPITYFYQSMAYLLINYSMLSMHWVLPLLQIFAMDLSITTSAGFCFVSGLTALSEEIWLFFIPFSLFISIAIIWMVLQCGASSYLLATYSIRYSPNVLGMVWSAWLLSMGTISCRLLKIIACTSISAESSSSFVHFYAPEHECFDAIWYLAAIGIIMMVTFWAMVWYKLYQMGHKNRQKASALHHQSIVSCYKDEHWYWEFVVQSRRMCIAILVTTKYLNEDYVNLILGAVLLLYLMIHFKVQPFKHKRINNMESLCLLMLICCFAVMNFAEKEGFIVIFLSIGLLSPFILFITRIYSCIKLFCLIKYGDAQLDIQTQEKLFKAIARLNESKRDLIGAIMHRTMPHIVIPTQNGADQDNIVTHGADNEEDDDDDGEILHLMDDEITSGNITFSQLNSPLGPGAVAPFHRQIRAAKGEESESFTPLVSRTVSNQQMTSSITYLEQDERDGARYKTKQGTNILDYHQFIHKIETTKDYSSTTMYDESRSGAHPQNVVIIDDVEQKYQYPVDGPAKNSSNKSDIDLALQMIGYITDSNSNLNKQNNDADDEQINARIQSAINQINNHQSSTTTT